MSEQAQRLRSRAGYSLIELLTAVAIFGVLAAAGLPHIDTTRQDIQSATKQVIADYRFARTRAITSGAHYNLNWTGTNTYQINRMKLVGTTWTADSTTVVKQVTLPTAISMYAAQSNVEFNTRGIMVSPTYNMFEMLWDGKFSTYRMISVWPSGQVNAYE
jgi:prepilin-type N-terminal cleavage/methylation domain-containing protein